MIIRPGGGIGRHAGLRSQCESVTVRVRPGAPINLISNIAGYGNGIRLVS